MGMLLDIPRAVDNVGMVLSATDLNAMRDNVALVDALTYRTLPCFDSSAGPDTTTPGFGGGTGDPYQSLRRWRGAFRFRTGMTTLTLTGRAIQTQSEVYRVYLNNATGGSPDATITPPVNPFSVTITISGRGYTDGQIIPIEIDIYGNRGTTQAIVVFDIYATPVVYAPSWPGTPTFSTAFDAAKINQLVDAYTWCYGRIAQTPRVPGLVQMYALGPFATADVRPMYYGSVQRSYTADQLLLSVQVVNPATTALQMLVYLGGSLAYTSPSWAPGTYNVDVTLSLSGVSVGNRAEVSVFLKITTAGPVASWKGTRLYCKYFGTSPSTNYPYASMPSAAVGYVDQSVATTAAFLNALSTAVANAKSRIDSNTAVWGRARAMRQYYTAREDHIDVESLQKRAPARFARLGDRLLVRGKKVSIGYGPLSTPSASTKAYYEDYSFQNTGSIIDSETSATQIAYLDSFKGLIPGTAYTIMGFPLEYAEELL